MNISSRLDTTDGQIYVIEYLQAFQFNSKYLIAIHDHVYSCQFGTFVGEMRAELDKPRPCLTEEYLQETVRGRERN